MRKLAALILIPALLLAGCSGKAAPAAAQPEEKVTYVKSAAAGAMNFQDILNLPGTVEPKESATITAKVGGTVKEVNVEIGSVVLKNTVLCKLDDTSYKLLYQKAEAALKNSKLTLERLKDYSVDSGLQPQQIEAARTAYNSAKLNLENTEKNYSRIKELYAVDSISKADFEAAETSYKLVKEQYDSAYQNLKQAERGWDYDVRGAEIGLQVSENDYMLAKENLTDTSIVSPIDGIVSSRSISPGENVSPGVILFNVVNIETLYMESGVSEHDVSFIKAGQPVKVTIDALPGKSFSGVVTGISPALDPKSKTYPVKVEITNEDSLIKAGMFGSMEVVLDAHYGSVSVPKEAVLHNGDSYYVFVMKDGRAVQKTVKLGYSNATHYEILQGLNTGEKLVVVGNSNLKDGDKIVEK